MMRIAVVLLVLLAHLARADDRADAEALFRAGEKAFDATQYAAAADAFEQAYAKLPLPAIAFSTAQAQRLQYFVDNKPQHLERAAELYHAYIDQQKTGGRVGDAVANLAQIEPLLHELVHAGGKPEPPAAKTTRLVVIADVAGARATIDGDSGPVPFVHEVTAGEHAITVEADGYATQTRKATALANEMVPVEVQLVARPAAVAVTGSGHVTIDARSVGDAPLAHLELAAGKHLVVIEQRGRVPYVREVELARGGLLKLEPALRQTGQRRAVPWVVAGGGALVVATGVAGLLAHGADSDAAHQHALLAAGGADPSVVTAYNHDLDDRTSRLHATELLGAAAGAVLATGVLLYLFDHPSPEAPPVAPLVGTGSIGVAVGGRF
jgi:PEGA domain